MSGSDDGQTYRLMSASVIRVGYSVRKWPLLSPQVAPSSEKDSLRSTTPLRPQQQPAAATAAADRHDRRRRRSPDVPTTFANNTPFVFTLIPPSPLNRQTLVSMFSAWAPICVQHWGGDEQMICALAWGACPLCWVTCGRGSPPPDTTVHRPGYYHRENLDILHKKSCIFRAYVHDIKI